MSSKSSPPGADPRNYEFPGTVVRVKDGDTFVARVRLAFGISHEIAVRLRDVNAPEMDAKDEKVAAAGLAAKVWLYDFLNPVDQGIGRHPAEVVLKSHKMELSFTRYVFDAWRVEPDGSLTDIAARLVQEGHAKEWHRS